MTGLFDAARARAKEAASTVLCAAGGTQRAINDFNGKVNPFYTGSRGEAVTRRLERELQRFCPVPEAPPPETPPPFAGGQCAGVTYAVTYFREWWRDFPEFATGSVTTSVVGPVSGIVSAPASPGDPATLRRWVLQSGSGDSFLGFNDSTSYVSMSITSVARPGGEPDVCGSLPGTPGPPPPPTNPRPTLPDVDVDFPGFPSITIPLIPVVGIVNVNIDGKITVPVTVNANFDLGGQNFDIDFNFDVDLGDPSADPTPAPDGRPTDDDDRPSPPDCPPPPDCAPEDEEDEEPDEPPIDPESPEDKKEEEIKAVRILAIAPPLEIQASEILMSGGAPNIFAPRIGSVKFVYAVSLGQVAWSTDIDVKATNQVIPAPKNGLRCLGAVFSPARGVEGETFFVRGRRCECS